MEFRWFCRQLGEQWATDPEADNPAALLYEDGDFIPNERLPDVAGGCFGNGPSQLISSRNFNSHLTVLEPINESLGVLNIATKSFVKVETDYEILLELR